ncbi:hypothetical protein [Streptomyces sp. Act143]|uniref:hypothetical protein n=1 Tax=Streptomyces sp. Act143 TaxID=2200760 RepID=UPI0011B78F07|nr:hypothetical protein [Streptomyces sp. Act143]
MNAQQRAGYDERIGKLHRDPQGRVGILTDILGTTAYLRPERGGREWPVSLDAIEPVTDKAQDREVLSAKVADANRRSRGEL